MRLTARGPARRKSQRPSARSLTALIGLREADQMTKRGIIEELLARRQGVTHRDSETIVNAMFEAMAEVLARGERIEIRGFGSFGVKERGARQGRNPRTGDVVEVAAKRIPFFRAGKDLRVEVNGAADTARKRSA